MKDVVAIDFDQDGRLDLAVLTSSALLVYHQTDDGWGEPDIYVDMIGIMKRAVAVDFNGDGLEDLLLETSAGFVHRMVNQGDGTLVLLPHLSAPPGPINWSHLVSGDINSDGIADIALEGDAGVNEGLVAVWIGHGDGDFTPAFELPVPFEECWLEFVDYDHDGDQDLLASRGQVVIFENLGGGAIEKKGPIDVGVDVWKTQHLDLDHDGTPETILWDQLSEQFYSMPVGLADPDLTVEPLTDGTRMMQGQFGGDVQLDVVVARRSGTSLWIANNSGGYSTHCCFEAGLTTVADMDKDGDDDLIHEGTFIHIYEVFEGNIGPAIAAPSAITPDYDRLLGAYDWDDDGVAELFARTQDDSVVLFKALPSGPQPIAPAVELPFDTAPADVYPGDFDLDGKLDLIVRAGKSSNNGTYFFFLGTDDGLVWSGPVFHGAAHLVAMAQIDGKNGLDLVFENPLTLRFHQGGANFGPKVHPSGGGEASSAAAGDIDGDGKTDLVGGVLGHIITFINLNGMPVQAMVLDDAGAVRALIDLDLDGDLDLVGFATDQHPTQLSYRTLLNNGNGVFSLHSTLPFEQNVSEWPLVEDWNRDGYPDLLLTYDDPLSLRIFLNDTEGGFIRTPIEFEGWGVTNQSFTGDFDGDGDSDTASSLGGPAPHISIIWNDDISPSACTADLTESGNVDSDDLNILLADFGCVTPDCPADLDGDGDTDSADLNLLLAAFGEDCP